MSTPPSKNTNITRISIPTEQLRALLPEEAMVQIERVAIEKIGEEVRRKIAEKQVNIEGVVKDAVRKLVADEFKLANETLSSTWHFPEAGKAVVRSLVKEAIETQTRTLVVDAVAAAKTKFIERLERHLRDAERRGNDAIQTTVNARVRELDDRISTKARTEFLSVLKEAKEAGL